MNAILESQHLNRLLNGVDIPPCPSILLELEAELEKDTVDQREISRLISRDPALAGQVMAVANSPAFAVGQQFASIMQAINVLGNRQLFNLVVAQLLKAALAGSSDLSMDRFWESSAQTARLAAELARRLRCVKPDVAYTFGLFHDCGIPLLMRRFPVTKDVLVKANGAEDRLFTEVEDELLGTNHAVVGYFLARRWRLPDYVAEAMLYHHDFSVLTASGGVSETAKTLIALCVLAEHVSRLHANGDGEFEWAKAGPLACDYFRLSLGAVDDLIEDLLDWVS